MKRLFSLILCYLLVTSCLVAFAESYVPSPTLEGKFPIQNPYQVLVNKEHKLPDNWLDYIKLVETQNSLGETFLVEDVTLQHFEALRTYLLENEGIQIELDSTYRPREEQEEIWNEWKEKYGEEYCEKYLARPGFSEHHTGLAIDIGIVKDGVFINDNDEMIAEREIFAKIHAKLAQHGFILRYPPEKETITGYNYEPWHFRFVGEDAAKTITEQKITLEEYLAQK